jgi:hypothetical protein
MDGSNISLIVDHAYWCVLAAGFVLALLSPWGEK